MPQQFEQRGLEHARLESPGMPGTLSPYPMTKACLKLLQKRFLQEQSSMRMQHSQRSLACLRIRRCCSPAGASWACCRMPASAGGLRSSFGRGQAGSSPTAALAWQCPRCHLLQVGTAAPFWQAPGALHCVSAVCTCQRELQLCSCLSTSTSSLQDALSLQCLPRHTCCTQNV